MLCVHCLHTRMRSQKEFIDIVDIDKVYYTLILKTFFSFSHVNLFAFSVCFSWFPLLPTGSKKRDLTWLLPGKEYEGIFKKMHATNTIDIFSPLLPFHGKKNTNLTSTNILVGQ